MRIETEVAGHYGQGGLLAAILAALAADGRDPDRLAADDLAPVDEFHVGGRAATEALLAQAAPAHGSRWLDIGSGLGGPARHIAAAHGCAVDGVDLTEEYVTVARDLTRRLGLDGRVTFHQGSALALGFPSGHFDGASMLHVGMNIADKPALCAEVRRVLRPGAAFAIYDVMRTGPGELAYPVPWAGTPSTSFLATPATYRAALETAGFAVAAERDRAGFALAAFRETRERLARHGRPALGLHIAMGPRTAEKLANLAAGVERGSIAPTEIIARAV